MELFEEFSSRGRHRDMKGMSVQDEHDPLQVLFERQGQACLDDRGAPGSPRDPRLSHRNCVREESEKDHRDNIRLRVKATLGRLKVAISIPAVPSAARQPRQPEEIF